MGIDPDKNCVIFKTRSPTRSVYLFHGAYSSAKRLIPQMLYLKLTLPKSEIIACDARGHGSRKGEPMDWKKSADDWKDFIARRNGRNNVYIGMSMGNAIAFNVARKIPPKKLIAIAPPYDGKSAEKWGRKLTARYGEILQKSESILPAYSRIPKSTSVCIAYSDKDNIITPEEPKKLAEKVGTECVKEINQISRWKSHQRLMVNPMLWKWVKERIKKGN